MYYNQKDDFFVEETRCDWKITSKMKKVYAVQIDLIRFFLEICEKHHLRCYAIFGTLLGAIRHEGYIPWDDDIDFAMPRKDYDKFLEIGAAGLPEPYFLQTTVSDVDSYEVHSSLRNSNTTGNCNFNMFKSCNNGIAIDILPLDGAESIFKKYRNRRTRIKFSSTLCNTYVNEVNQTLIAKILRKFLRTFFKNFPYQKIYLNNEEKLRKFDFDDCEKVSQILGTPETAEKLWFNRKDFDQVIYRKFETIMIPCPAGYDNILRTVYGNYMKFPPMDQRGDKHQIEYEPDIPYKKFCKEKYGVIYEK